MSVRKALHYKGFSLYSSALKCYLVLSLFCIEFIASLPFSVFTSLIILSYNTRTTHSEYKLALPARGDFQGAQGAEPSLLNSLITLGGSAPLKILALALSFKVY